MTAWFAKKKDPARTPEEFARTPEEREGQARIIAVTDLMVEDSWEELGQSIRRNWGVLESKKVDNVIDALVHAFQEDAYSTSVIRERSNLLGRCKTEGVTAVFSGTPLQLKQTTNSIRFIARAMSIKARGDLPSAAKDLIKLSDNR
jgi:hypothetical protein